MRGLALKRFLFAALLLSLAAAVAWKHDFLFFKLTYERSDSPEVRWLRIRGESDSESAPLFAGWSRSPRFNQDTVRSYAHWYVTTGTPRGRGQGNMHAIWSVAGKLIVSDGVHAGDPELLRWNEDPPSAPWVAAGISFDEWWHLVGE